MSDTKIVKSHNWYKWLMEGGKLEEIKTDIGIPVDLRDCEFVEDDGIVRLNNKKYDNQNR